MFFHGSVRESSGYASNEDKKSREGDISVENPDTKTQKKHLKKDVGDYVDFEEVE